MNVKRALVLSVAVLFLSGCVVTETWDIGNSRMRTGSQDLARGRTTVEELLDLMGIPFAIGQGEEEGVEAYLYIDLRKRQKSLMIPPILPIYARTRVTEKKRAMMVIYVPRVFSDANQRFISNPLGAVCAEHQQHMIGFFISAHQVEN